MLKIGIVGSGFGLYGLLPAFNSIKGCEVVCICGNKTPRLEKYCKSIGLASIYSDWEVMLKNENLDAIALAVVPNAQYKIAKAAMAKRLDVFAEKPLAANLKQAKELSDLADKNKIVTAVDFIFPEIAQWQKAKQIIDSKKFGKLSYISTSWDFLSYDIKNKIKSWKTDPAQGGGALSFYFPHVLYYLEHFCGEISGIKSSLAYSKGSLNGGETGVDLLLEFKNKAKGAAHLSCNAPGMNKHQLTFLFERGSLILENQGSVTENFNIKAYTAGNAAEVPVKKEKNIPANQDERVKVVRKIAARFVEGCIRGGPVTPCFKDGLRVQELIGQIRKAA